MINDKLVMDKESEHRKVELQKFDDRCYKNYLDNDKSYLTVAKIMGYSSNKIRFAVARKIERLLEGGTKDLEDQIKAKDKWIKELLKNQCECRRVNDNS